MNEFILGEMQIKCLDENNEPALLSLGDLRKRFAPKPEKEEKEKKPAKKGGAKK